MLWVPLALPGEHWKVRHDSGAPVVVTVGPEGVTVKGKAVDVSIPAGSLVEAGHAREAVRRSKQFGAQIGDASPSGLALLPATGVSALMKGARHYIFLRWREWGMEQELVLETGKDQYLPLLRALEGVSGVRPGAIAPGEPAAPGEGFVARRACSHVLHGSAAAFQAVVEELEPVVRQAGGTQLLVEAPQPGRLKLTVRAYGPDGKLLWKETTTEDAAFGVRKATAAMKHRLAQKGGR